MECQFNLTLRLTPLPISSKTGKNLQLLLPFKNINISVVLFIVIDADSNTTMNNLINMLLITGFPIGLCPHLLFKNFETTYKLSFFSLQT